MIKELNINTSIIFSLFIIIFLSVSCAVNPYKIEEKMILNSLNQIYPEYESLPSFILVKVDSQKLIHFKKGRIVKVYSVSTSAYGTGSKINSYKTPLGRHKIDEKIGKDLPKGAILKGRKWTGAIANLITEPIDTKFDVVTSRILWLTGLEEGLNKGPGVDSKDRYIYIHGTAEEGLIGKPASDGCVSMYNYDVISLFDKVDIDTELLII